MPTLEQRVSDLENQMRQMLDQKVQPKRSNGEPWWKRHSGAFENNPLYDEAMQLATDYRKAQPSAADSPEEFTD